MTMLMMKATTAMMTTIELMTIMAITIAFCIERLMKTNTMTS